MKELLFNGCLCLTLISCGKVITDGLDLTEHFLTDKKDKQESNLQRRKYFNCSLQAYNNRCLAYASYPFQPIGRLLQPRELYNYHCYQGYLRCLNL